MMLALRTAKRRILRAVQRSTEMLGGVIRREIDQKHNELCVKVGVWTEEVAGAVPHELGLDRDFRPRCSLAVKRIEHCLGEIRTEKPIIKRLPEWLQIFRESIDPTGVHVALVAVTEVIEF